MEKTTRVIVVENQKIVGLYLETCIGESSDCKIVASLPYADELPEYVAKHKADLIILNVTAFKDSDPLLIVKQIKSEYPNIKTLLYSSLPFAEWIKKAKEYGVESVWHAEYSNSTLLESISKTINGQSIYPDEILEVYLGKLALSKLTENHKRILHFLIYGLTNKEIAEKLFLSANTVKSYLDDIMMMSEIHSRTELAVHTSKLGL